MSTNTIIKVNPGLDTTKRKRLLQSPDIYFNNDWVDINGLQET